MEPGEDMPAMPVPVPFMEIRDDSGTVIFHHGGAPRNEQFTWQQSGTDKQYSVTSALPPRPEHRRLVARFRHINLSMTFLITGIASGLLTLVIVRPLKQLKSFSQHLSQGDLDSRLDQRLTQRRDEIGQLAHSLNDMAVGIQQLLDSKQQLLHDVSHELRAPLTRLQVATELALGDAEGTQKKYADRIHHEVDNLEQLIDEILMLAKLEQQSANTQYQDICPLLRQAVDDFSFAYQREVNCQLPEQCFANCDAALLKRALDNLLSNAGKYTPASAAIELNLSSTSNQVEITLRDHGPGLAKDELENLFKPFVRHHQHSKGYGLGLAISRRAITAQGGNLRAWLPQGGGLAFSITLNQRKP